MPERLTALSPALEAEVRAFLDAGAKADGHGACVQFCSSLNFHQSMKSWFVGRKPSGALSHVLSTFAPNPDEVEISCLVAPECRRRGLFRAALAEALGEARGFGYRKALLPVERASVAGRAAAIAVGATETPDHTEYEMTFRGNLFSLSCGDSLLLRRALPSDRDAIVAASAAIFGETAETAANWTDSRFASRFWTQYLALREGVPVGVCAVHREGGGAGINGLGVVPDSRGRGYGREIVVKVIRDVGPGIPVGLEVDSVNEAALSLYKKLGFGADRAVDYFPLAF